MFVDLKVISLDDSKFLAPGIFSNQTRVMTALVWLRCCTRESDPRTEVGLLPFI